MVFPLLKGIAIDAVQVGLWRRKGTGKLRRSARVRARCSGSLLELLSAGVRR